MKRLRNIIGCLCLLATGIWGCMDDKGNYDYDFEGVMELEIDTVGMDQTLFWITYWNRGETVRIEGFKVKYDKPDNFVYRWLLRDYPYQMVTEGNSQVYPPADTIGMSLDLEYVVDLDAGKNYQVWLLVKDTVNGVSSYMRAHTNNYITVPEAGALTGVFCLQEKEGRVDINVFGTPLSLIFTDTIHRDYWSSSHPERPLNGKAKAIYYSSTGKWFYIFTDEEGFRCSPAGLTIMETWNEMFYTAPAYDPEAFVCVNNCDFLINAGKLHCLYVDAAGDRKFPASISGDYNLAPFLATETRTTYRPVTGAINAYQVVYDTEQNGFRPFFNRAIRLSQFSMPAPEAPFNVNKLVGELIYTATVNGGETMAIMKRDGEYWMDVACFYNVVDDGKLARRSLSLAGCPDFDKASRLLASNGGSTLFYTVGSTLYSFNYTTGQTDAVKLWQGNSDEEITCMEVIPTGGFPVGGRVLWIAVWNKQTEEGRILEFEFSPTTGRIEDMWGPMFGAEGGSPYVHEGFGKVVSMTVVM